MLLLDTFVEHPRWSLLVALVFLVALAGRYWATGGLAWPAVIAAVVWMSWAAHEYNCRVKGYNIRVDLFLIEPLVLVVTVWGLIGIALASGPRKPR